MVLVVVTADDIPDRLAHRLGDGSHLLAGGQRLGTGQRVDLAGMRLRIPGTGARPAFPAFSTDFSQWRAIASHTTRFVNFFAMPKTRSGS